VPSKKSNPDVEVPTSKVHIPLDGKPWVGADNKKWMDLAADAGMHSVFWLRRRHNTSMYFLVASCPGGHVLTKQIDEETAKYIYNAFPTRAPWELAFAKPKRTVKRTAKSAKSAKSSKAPKKKASSKTAKAPKKKAAPKKTKKAPRKKKAAVGA